MCMPDLHDFKPGSDPTLARKHADEFVGVFAPAIPPHGWEKLVEELDGWTNGIILQLDGGK